MSSKLSKQELISQIKDMRKSIKNGGIRKKAAPIKKKLTFIHVGLKPLAKLAVLEGNADPKDVYAKHHYYHMKHGSRSNLTWNDLGVDGDVDMDNDRIIDSAGVNSDDVVHVDTDVTGYMKRGLVTR